ncbi:MAG: endolytic transglycosylase MltG [Acidobacteriota bacterium]
MTGRRALVAALVALPVVLLVAALGLGAWCVLPQGRADAPPSLVTIEPGMTARQIAERLDEAGIVGPAWLTSRLLRLTGIDRSLRAGEYELRPGLAPYAVLREIRRGRVVTVPVTLREGLDLFETAEAIAATGIASREALVAAFSDPAPIRDLDPEAEDLEGYLFPETYRFARGADPADIARTMVAQFRARFAEPEAARIAASGLTLRQIVTLASLVEKETAVPDERARIAGVFLERLARGMRLQCDPTVIYALKRAGRWDGNIRKADLSWDHPYNTYVRSGLPPGPIASPGLEALRAVLAPERDGSLYFVATGDGRHRFSRTFREHRKAVAEYLRERRRRRAATP